MLFCEIKVGVKFYYDGDYFEKTGYSLAWELRNGKPYKEWGFRGDESVTL